MKMTSCIGAVLALAASGAALAAPIGVEGLFFSARDTTNNTSIVVNLNLTTTAFRSAPLTTRTLSGDGLADLSAWLSTAALDSVVWNVAGASDDGSGFSGAPTPLYGGLSTGTDIESVFPGWGVQGGLQTTVGNFTIFRNVVNARDVPPEDGVAELAVGDGLSVAGQAAWFFVNQNGGVGFQSTGAVGEALAFYSFFADALDPDFTGAFSKFAGQWRLNFANGVASLAYSADVTPTVPLPPAVWLLGSALLGLMGIARRKAAAAAAA